jgi:hypothetical protein
VTRDAAVFDRVRQAVAGDLRPVRRLWSPGRRVLLLAPVALAIAAVATQQYGRNDLATLGAVIVWGFFALQCVLALLVFGVALCLAVPGYGMSRRSVGLMCAAVATVLAVVTLTTFVAHPTFAHVDRGWRLWNACVRGALPLGVPLLLLSCLLAARAFPAQPTLVGALCGLATGLVTDAGWRLTCEVSAPSHVVTAHHLAIAVMAGAGAIFTAVLDRRRWRSLTL